MATLDQLKQKYQPALNLMGELGVHLQNLNMDNNNRLFVRAAAPSQDAANKVWDEIKRIDPSHQDIMADIQADPSLAAQQQQQQEGTRARQGGGGETYTVQSGDTLSKISKHFYGDANRYMDIFNANRDKLKDPNMIQAGQVLTIPPK